MSLSCTIFEILGLDNYETGVDRYWGSVGCAKGFCCEAFFFVAAAAFS